jgi:NAD(P)-dependent dehydrogenase (short-subunit alcohol dehydrogenase family)
MSKNILITGASSGFGALTARALADAGHTTFASMRDVAGRNAKAASDAAAYADENDVDLRSVELDVSDQGSVDRGVAEVRQAVGEIDVVIHNAGHLMNGPAEAFAPEQLAAAYDTNVISTQRVNRAALPAMRRRGDGLILWVGSSSTRGGTPPYLGPYFAAKAAEDSLAVTYAAELARFGIETTIMVPGAFATGTNHFANAGRAEDAEVVAEYEERYAGLSEQVGKRLAELSPPDADPAEVARQIVRVVGMERGERPFRVHVDPVNDGAEEVSAVADDVRERFYRRFGIEDLLRPTT